MIAVRGGKRKNTTQFEDQGAKGSLLLNLRITSHICQRDAVEGKANGEDGLSVMSLFPSLQRDRATRLLTISERENFKQQKGKMPVRKLETS
jgi:hypothetical protein